MRSSETTYSRPKDRSFPLWVIVRGDDHPKACTGRRLLARRVARRLPRIRPVPPIVLDPYAPTVLSRSDRGTAREGGIAVLDCSWNALARRASRGVPHVGDGWGPRRRLPFLLATNPQHFGRLAELNTAEALAAALTVLGERSRAEEILSGFHGGPTFFETNAERLKRYAACPDPGATRREERRIFGGY